MAKDLTRGQVTPLLLRFTLPLILSNLFQLTYTAVDSIIIGHFVGDEALAAVGICGPVINLMLWILSGLCMGASILMGAQFGAKEYDTLKRQISTTLLSGGIFSLLLTLLCILFATPLLRLLQVNEAILSETVSYLRIIFLGLIFTFVYNFYSNTLRAMGDSKTPLYFLIVSSVLNIVGDLLFVTLTDLGSRGCAIATVLSQALCCLLCALYTRRTVPLFRLGRGWLVLDPSILRRTVSYGGVSIMQQATVQLGKIGMQTIVNTMPVPVTAAFTAVNRVDDFAYTPEQNIGHAMTAMMAQNKGAGKPERMRESFRVGMRMELIYSIALGVAVFLLAGPIMRLFSADSEVIGYGTRYLRIIAFMYILPSFTNGIQGYFRGIGDLKVTFLSSFVNTAVRLVAGVILVFGFDFGIEALPVSYLIGWFAMLGTEVPLLVRSLRGKKRFRQEEPK